MKNSLKNKNKMVTIKGPITIGKDTNIAEFCRKAGIKIKLPFTATGFKCTKNEDFIPDSMKAKVKVSIKPSVKVKETIEKSSNKKKSTNKESIVSKIKKKISVKK